MDQQKRQGIKLPVQLGTLSVAIGTVTIYLSLKLTSSLIYDRAAISNGEFWRLISGHLVHFNASHLSYNLTAFVLTAWIIEAKKGVGHFGPLCLFIMLRTSVLLLALKPDRTQYGGLSGLICGLLVYRALIEMGNRGPWRLLWLLVLLIIPLKILFESHTERSILPSPQPLSFVPMWESHAIGSLSALSAFGVQTLFKSNRRRRHENQKKNSLNKDGEKKEDKLLPVPDGVQSL